MESTIISLITFLTINANSVSALTGYATNDGEGNLWGNACGMDGTADAFNNWAWTAIGDAASFDDGYGCGNCYQLKCTGAYGNNPMCSCDTTKTLTIQAINWCGTGDCVGDHIFDLTAAAMTHFTGSADMTRICGEISIEYERVDCSSITGNFKVTNKEGTSIDWYGFHLDDVNDDGGIRYVELLKDGEFVTTCDKSDGPSYWRCNGKIEVELPLDIKITSDLGKSVTACDCITSLAPYTEMRCNTNLNADSVKFMSSDCSSGGSSGSSSDKIQILVNTGSNEWWMAIEFPNDDSSAITKLEFMDSNHQWITGEYEAWGTFGAYSFGDTGSQFSGNQNFRVTTSSGTATTSDVFSGVSPGSIAYINLP